jgi:hypothetical protein
VSDSGDEKQSWTKVCARYSVHSQTAGDFCPNCGKAYGSGKRSGQIKWVAGAIVVLLVCGVAAGIVTKISDDKQVTAEQVASARNAANARTRAREAAQARAEATAAKKSADQAKRANATTS